LICPACIIDLSRIAYVLDYNIHVMHGDGTADVDTGVQGFAPALSHDRTRIAYVAYDNKVWVMNIDGSNGHPVTAGTTVESDPSFSPDDTKLVCMSAAWDGAGYGNEVYTVSSTPASPKTVAQCKKLTSTAGTWLYRPRFNAAGDRVAFQLGIFQDYNNPTAQIAEVDATLSNQTMQYWTFLTTPTYGQSNGEGYVKTSDGDPVFSSGGTKLAYVDWNSNGAHIWTMLVNGSSKTQLTSGSDEDMDPDWNGAGSRIVFTSDRSYTTCYGALCLIQNQYHTATNLFAINADGSNLTRLTGTTGHAESPSWQ
jgi:Tol biopolymer transport system component